MQVQWSKRPNCNDSRRRGWDFFREVEQVATGSEHQGKAEYVHRLRGYESFFRYAEKWNCQVLYQCNI